MRGRGAAAGRLQSLYVEELQQLFRREALAQPRSERRWPMGRWRGRRPEGRRLAPPTVAGPPAVGRRGGPRTRPPLSSTSTQANAAR